jgi:type IV secretion system protein VirB10
MTEIAAEHDENMAPDASPGVATKRTGVRRVNNVPMYLIGGAMGAFLLVMGMEAADRAAKQNAIEEANDKGGNSSMFANEIAGDKTGGIVPALDVPALQLEPTPAPLLVARPNLDNPPAPPGGGGPASAPDEEANRIRQAKWHLFEEAVKAKTGVQAVAPRSSGSTPGALGTVNNFAQATAPKTRAEMLERIKSVQDQINTQPRGDVDPTAAYQAKKAMMLAGMSNANNAAANNYGYGNTYGGYGGYGSAGGGLLGGGVPSMDSSAQIQQHTQSGNNTGTAFADNPSEGDRWKMDQSIQSPRTPYEVRAGYVIPATLISGLNSEVQGQIIAQVAQNVYDTPTGKHKLIPTGSRLVGTYDNGIKYGQNRILIAWQRIVFPDGKALDIGAMPGADEAGYAGLQDEVNHHYFRIFGSAVLMSVVTAGISSTQQQQSSGTYGGAPNANNVISAAMGQQLGQVTAQMIAKNLNIAPTLEIRPGFRFNIMVNKDLTFTKPYTAFDY